MLISQSSHIRNVRELHVAGRFLTDGQSFHHLSEAMPNVVSVSFFNCGGPNVFRLLTPTGPSSPLFPNLQRVTVLGPESWLELMARARKNYGMPLKTLVVGRAPMFREC